MIKMPKRLKSSVPISVILEVEDWWNKLSEANKKELEDLYISEKRDDSRTVSIFLCGKYVEQDRKSPNDYDVFWINYFYEYIVNHEMVIDETKVHVGGVCFSNKRAEEAVRKGFIDKDFSCPNNDEKCLMKSLLKDGKGESLKLFVKFKLE